MSVSGIMGTSTSGMAAQSDRLSATAENIANIGTTGYKRGAVEFSTLVTAVGSGRHESGAVESHSRRIASEQGVLQATRSSSDLAIEGDGFFVVQGPSSDRVLTRAGAFIRDREGFLTNTAGYRLLAAPIQSGTSQSVPASVSSLVPVSFEQTKLKAAASTAGALHVNLPAGDSIVAQADLPSSNAGTTQYSAMTSLNAYDSIGTARQLDFFFAKTNTNSWEVSVFDHAARGTSQPFPYTSGPLASVTLQFDPATGGLTSSSSASLVVPVQGGQPVSIDLGNATELAAEFSVRAARMDGHAPVGVERIDVSDQGLVTAIFADGTQVPSFRIPIGKVASPDMLTAIGGNLFAVSDASGQMIIEFSNESGAGRIKSGALELSTVDLANELTVMIEAQRNYTANSRVFQTASDLMDVIVNLRR
jgi:flagellar hook protein FlgE